MRNPLLGAGISLAVAVQGQVLEPVDCWTSAEPDPYTTIREADVKWERRVWRTIDLLDPANLHFKGPGPLGQGCSDLLSLIRSGLGAQDGPAAYVPASSGEDGSFQNPMDRRAASVFLLSIDTLAGPDVQRFMIKEDWIFDARRSVMEVRIIGLAPMVVVRGTEGEPIGHRALFWLYYPHWRPWFAARVAFFGADGPLSFEDIFAQRRFRGTIVKVNNMQDRFLSDHAAGLEVLMESEDVREQLRNLGFDLWSY